MNATLGARLGTKHKSPSLDKDLVALRTSMQEHNIFAIESGRVLCDMKKPVVPNVVTVGLGLLHAPLQEYNRSFQQLQLRRRETPLADGLSPPSSPEAGNNRQFVPLPRTPVGGRTANVEASPVRDSSSDVVGTVSYSDIFLRQS